MASTPGAVVTTYLTWSENTTMHSPNFTAMDDSQGNLSSNMNNMTNTDSAQAMSTSAIMTTIYITFGVVGMLGNGLVVFVLVTSPKLRTSITNIYIISQSTLDALVSISVIALSRIDTNNISYTGIAAEIYCRMWLNKLPLWWFMLASTYNLVALTLERYLNVVHPIWHKVHFNRNVAYGTIAFVVIVSFIHQCYTFIPTSGVVDGDCWLYYNFPSPTAQRMYGICVVTLRFFIPLIVFVYAYARIAYVIHKKVQQKESQSSQEAAKEKWTRGRRNAIKTMALVSVAYLLCMAINQIYFFSFNVGFPADYTSNFYHASVALVYLNSTINPFIYAAKYEQFNLAARKKFCGRCIHSGATNSITDSSTNDTTNGAA